MSYVEQLISNIQSLRVEIAKEEKIENISVRDFAQAVGISPATAHRIKSGSYNYSLQIAKKVFPFMENCPCCGAPVSPQEGDK